MASAPFGQHGVFLGNLDDGHTKKEVAAMISRLILQATGLTVDLTAIKVRRSGICRCFTACIRFRNQSGQHRALKALKNYATMPDGLVKSGRKLKVDVYKPKITAAQLPNINDPTSLGVSKSHETYFKDESGETSARAQFSGTTHPATHPVTQPATQPNTNSISESIKTYHRRQQLGNETRILEFKKAGGDLQKHLKKHLARYTCAFLNSEGGTLMLGVDDTGSVQGVHCDRKQEDNIRINIDDIIHQFDPSVLPHMYQVQFVPITDDSEIQPNLKVIEITVIPSSGRADTLYETPNGEVYIRRDGSVRGPLRPKDIQEWCRLKFTNSQVNTEEAYLKDQVDDLQERLQRLECNQQDDDIKDRKNIKRTSSAVCTIL